MYSVIVNKLVQNERMDLVKHIHSDLVTFSSVSKVKRMLIQAFLLLLRISNTDFMFNRQIKVNSV